MHLLGIHTIIIIAFHKLPHNVIVVVFFKAQVGSLHAQAQQVL
jgi:hypothetical protein